MSLQNINNLQIPHSYKEYVEDYLNQSLSALANSGNRYNINSEGIKYFTPSILEIFTDESILSDTNKNGYLKFEISNNSISQLSINKNNISKNLDIDFLENIIKISDITDNLKYKLLYQYCNNIEEFHNDSYFSIKNKLFTGFIKGKLNQDDNCELIYFQYDIQNNLLKHYIITQKYGKLDEYDDWYIVYNLNYQNTNLNEYKLQIYLYRLDWLVTKIKDDLLTEETKIISYIQDLYLFNSKLVNQENNENPLTFFKTEFQDYQNFYQLYKDTNKYDNISFLNYILTIDNNELNNENNTQSNYYLFNDIIITNNDIYQYDNNLSILQGYISENNQNLYLNSIQNIINIYNLVYNNYYHASNYFSDNSSNYKLYKLSIYQLIEDIYSQIIINQNQSTYYIYIPLSLRLNCLISDKMASKLYSINSLYVKFINNENEIFKNKSDLVNPNYIYYCGPNVLSHVSIYNIQVDYLQDLVNQIITNKLYTLPYLNSLNNWVIDDLDTSSSIIQNQYIGIKEIYLHVSKNGDQLVTELLNISDPNIRLNFTDDKSDEQEFIVNPKYFFKYDYQTIKCKTKIPNLINANDSIKEFFENSIIISICDKDILGNSEYIQNYAYDYIYSLWQYTNSGFKLISFENDYAFDPFNNMEIVEYYNQKYKFTSNLLTSSNISNNLSSSIKDEYYLSFRNKLSKYYNNTYKNDYNAILEYVPQIKEDGTNPIYDNQFINDISNLKITNTIYPEYTLIQTYESVTELKNTIQRLLSNDTTKEIYLTIDGPNYTETIITKDNINEIIKVDENTEIVNKLVTIGVKKSNEVDSQNYKNYNEYIFNENIPTFDGKEIFLRNINTLNRINILGIDSDSGSTKIYNGYIGTSFKDSEKNKLYISTGKENINIGTDTLLNINQYDKFSQFDTLQIDGFKNIIFSNKINDNIILYGLSIIPQGYISVYTPTSNTNIKTENSIFICNIDNGNNRIFNINKTFLIKSILNNIFGEKQIENVENQKIQSSFENINSLQSKLYNISKGTKIINQDPSNGDLCILNQPLNISIVVKDNDINNIMIYLDF